MIKRIMLLLTVALVMALMMVASAVPAFSKPPPFAANENDSCIGQAYSGDVPVGYDNKGQFVSGIANDGGGDVGENSRYYATQVPRDDQRCILEEEPIE